jgi:hypothetical protein
MTQNIKSINDRLTFREFKEFLSSLDINIDNYRKVEFALKISKMFPTNSANHSIKEFLEYEHSDFRRLRGFGEKTIKLVLDIQQLIQDSIADKMVIDVVDGNEDINVLLAVIERLSKDKNNIDKLIKIRNKAEEVILKWIN